MLDDVIEFLVEAFGDIVYEILEGFLHSRIENKAVRTAVSLLLLIALGALTAAVVFGLWQLLSSIV